METIFFIGLALSLKLL
ncbi:hypothetical protein AAHA92_12198 [Salvia divinorum]|uniref:Uncharacterized protein n=1 Tax=Salvia divinorum TaxID=28513 RepID=A0ABD1HJL0_SALDI